ncbi:hypothetical protein EON63_12415 [archaeon]|nr:MAG: hypothetical protein EON63_12415 [archaeon]
MLTHFHTHTHTRATRCGRRWRWVCVWCGCAWYVYACWTGTTDVTWPSHSPPTLPPSNETVSMGRLYAIHTSYTCHTLAISPP